ncbi:MAG TPA: TolC family protein [Leucothrix mucor]|nr:TolC family protein [Leucothrix mucor]
MKIKMIPFFSAVFAISLMINTVVAAQVPITPFNQLVKIAINNNSTLKAKQLAWKSLIQQYPQATALNDPRLVYSESLRPIETRLGPQERALSINQKIPYPGKLALKGEVVKQRIEIAKLRYDQASRDLIVDLKKSYHELVYLENAIKLSLRNKKSLEKITRISTFDYAANISSLNDVAKAQSQYAQVAYDVQLLEELRSTENTRINTLLNRNPEQVFRINSAVRKPAKLPHSLKSLYQWAESNDELKIADVMIKQGELKKQLSQYASRPDFDFGLRYTQIGSTNIAGLEDNSRDGIAVSIGINIPLNLSKNKAIKEQARLEQLRSIEDKKSLMSTLKNKVKGVYFKLNNSHRLITLYGNNLIPQANRAMHIAELQYRENKGSIAKYVETQSTWLNFQLAYHRALADYAKSIAEMEKLTGRKL